MNREQDFLSLATPQGGSGAAPSMPLVGSLTCPEGPDGPRVHFPGSPDEGVVGRTCVALGASDCGKSVVLLFEANDWRRPLIVGLIRDCAVAAGRSAAANAVADPAAALPEKLRLTAASQMVFQCGKSSLTLTKSGKVLIEGTYVLSNSIGLNRIRGGSVEIN